MKEIYWIFILLIVYIINIGLIIYFNPLSVVDNFTKTFIFFSIFTGFLNLLLWKYFSIKANAQITTSNKIFKLLKILSTLFIFYTLIYTIYYYIVFTPWPLTILITILNIIVVIGALALIYKYFKKNYPSGKIGLVFELIINLVFYIPCLFIDLIEYIKSQYKITTKTVWIILLIEIIIIALRYILPLLYKIYHNTDGSLVEKGPIYLNNEKNLGVFQNQKLDISTTKNPNINYNYAISTWIWINPQPESTSQAYNKSTSLLNYGNVLNINFNKNKLEFWALSTSNENNKEITFGPNEKVKIFEFKNIPYQKWNNVVLNYNGGTLDIFINNILVSSNINITPVMYYNEVISGANNGINGGIKDLVYYNKVLSKNDIYSIYSIG